MGGAVSAGEDNDNLVDNLVSANYIRTGGLIEIFRAVDRGHYYLKGQRTSAYHDIAWKFNHLHLSAPCIYSEVMEHLDLHPGMSFLNLGSGTGYLSTMAGLVLGASGINHGIEIHADVVEYAQERLKEFLQKSPAFDRFEFCEPKFSVGNCLLLPPDIPGYDRVYCGAACPPEYASYLMNLLNIGGKLVLPLEDQLQVKTRTGEQTWDTKNALSVSFAYLVTPSNTNNNLKITNPPDRTVPRLQELARFCVRRVVRSKYKVPMLPKKKKKKRERHHSLGIEEQIVSRRKMARRLRRRRINTMGEATSRHLRRRRNTTGDSDHLGSSDSGQSSDNDSDDEVDTGITDIKEEAAMELSARDDKESSPQADLASTTKEISLDDAKDGRGDEKKKSTNSKGPTSTNHSHRSHFKFLRKRKSKDVDRTSQDTGEGSSASSRKTTAENSSTNMENQETEGEEHQRSQTSGRDAQVVRSLRSGRLVHALMRGLTRLSQEPNETISLASALAADRDTDSEEEYSSENGDAAKKTSDSGSDSDDLYKPLPETAFTIAIRKLPLPPKMIDYLLYHRQ